MYYYGQTLFPDDIFVGIQYGNIKGRWHSFYSLEIRVSKPSYGLHHTELRGICTMNEASKNLNRLLNEQGDNIKRINDSIMQSEFSPIRGIYIDLPLLKDTRMGLMLSLSSPEWMDYLGKGLERYNIRPNRSFTFAYPEFPVKESDLESMYHDPERSDTIFDYSPDTELYQSIPILLTQVQNRNKKAGNASSPILTLNIWPLKKSPIINQFVKFFHLYNKVNAFHMNVISQDPSTLSWDFWKKQQLLFIDNLMAVCSEKSELRVPLLEERQMTNVMMFAAWQASNEVLKVWKEEATDFSNMEHLQTRFELTALYFSICMNFSFSLFPIPIPQQYQQR